ncbi:hypothetical protein ACLMJK_008287 [Lecanora helva]
MPRSQTTPILTSAPENPEKTLFVEQTVPLTLTTDIASEDAPAGICLSPSWSDHGEKARKKERRKAEKAQKEREKKVKQDEERQKVADLRSGKRLSKKPPPAAMETQKLPTSLRRNSWISFISAQSSSGENSRRSSRDERRLSFGSVRSKRSQSTPGTSTETPPATAGASEAWHSIVSSSAPKLPSFRWSNSRKTSPEHLKSASSGSDDSYDKELIAFAYQFQSSESVVGPETTNTGRTEPTFKSVPYDSVSSKSPQRSPVREDSKAEIKPAKGHDSSYSTPLSPGLLINKELPSPPVMAPPMTRPSHDGNSYVHKQRMYQQQQSIAGFEDQQAVAEATEAARLSAAELEANPEPCPIQAPEEVRTSSPSKEERVASPSKPTRAQQNNAHLSPIYTKQRDRSLSPQTESTLAKDQPEGPNPLSHEASKVSAVSLDAHQARPTTVEDSVILSKPQIPPNSKGDKILGFRRKTKQPPTILSIPYNVENQVVAIHSAPPSDSISGESVAKRSRIERFFKEPKPAFTEKERRSSSSSSQSRVKEFLSETNPKQSHNRTRTASSTVLNNSTFSPLPGDATQPGPNESSKHGEKGAQAKKSEITQDNAKIAPKGSPKKSHTRQASATTENKPKSKKSSGATSPAKCAEVANPSHGYFEVEGAKKQAHEIIVQSETGEGLVRKTSIKRPRSNPQLQTQTTATNSLPGPDFLPPLKHQPLVKKERQSPTRPANREPKPVSIAQFQEPIAALSYESPSPPDLKLIPRSPRRPPSQFPAPAANRFNRSSTEVGTVSFGKGTLADGVDAKPLAKLFVICCKCKFWHDLPSKLYEAMALPLELHKADQGKVAGGRLETAVKCPWCEHAMTTTCCQGWTTVVYMHERHH